ncbi:hypothetical protein M2171_000194 [Bradyrhizobium japonicum USDA 38]|uniref:hypothetical protein n=1 Tax=Bradyrhizobium japonicum TaxID=375 RepID=UPI001FD90AD6|nr:hypothetical protein [Bradyrhizobium japonicum]MCS3891061.1 hypothetical protein [Bradyrhizobium japonicum USDA 38]MCS3943577.1 hypothetical protein [Bradyrhizobium japonicum]
MESTAMEAASGPEMTGSAVEASAASEVPTTVKSAASEMSATAPMSTAPMSTAPMSAAARRGGRSRRQGCAKSDHAKQFQSFHRFSPGT